MNPATLVIAIIGGLGATCCIGLIALAAVMFPVFRQARNAARRTICASNLRQIGAAMSLYASDNDGYLPEAGRWMDQIERYGPERILRCPEARTIRRSAYGYAFNSALGSANLSKAKGTTPLVFDSTLLDRNAASGLETLPRPGRHVFAGGPVDNVLLVDGGVMARKQ